MYLATFMRPEHIGNTPASLLWIVPLLASISVVYKATKVNRIDTKRFVRETAGLFGSILVFITLAAIVLCLIAWFINDLLPAWTG
jgi:hypothetical protein